MKLSWELKKPESEILNMPMDDFQRWVAFFQLLDEEAGKTRSKSKSRTGRRGRGR